jgi:hypothetical protein
VVLAYVKVRSCSVIRVVGLTRVMEYIHYIHTNIHTYLFICCTLELWASHFFQTFPVMLKVLAGAEWGGHKKLLCVWSTSVEPTASIYRVESCCYLNMEVLGFPTRGYIRTKLNGVKYQFLKPDFCWTLLLTSLRKHSLLWISVNDSVFPCFYCHTSI